MILNVIDRRRRPYRWRKINAIIESTWHDNSCQDSDQAEDSGDDDDVPYDEREGISLTEAIAWASAEKDGVTLYFYDFGDGTTAIPTDAANSDA